MLIASSCDSRNTISKANRDRLLIETPTIGKTWAPKPWYVKQVSGNKVTGKKSQNSHNLFKYHRQLKK